MSHRELVSVYLDGQIGRRAFIRRLVASGISLAAAMSYARLLGTDPAHASHDPNDPPDEYPENGLIVVGPNSLTPQIERVPRGGLVQWDFIDVQSAGYHLRRYQLVNDSPLPYIGFPDLAQNTLNRGHQVMEFYAAGTYHYFVNVWSREDGQAQSFPVDPSFQFEGCRIEVKLGLSRTQIHVGRYVTVTWATQDAPGDGFAYDVDINPPGPTAWKPWLRDVTYPSARRRLSKKGNYQFRARLTRYTRARTGWSPIRRVKVV